MHKAPIQNNWLFKGLQETFKNWPAAVFRPNQFFPRVLSGEIRNWLFPMLLLSFSAVLQSVVQGSALTRVNETQSLGMPMLSLSLINLASLWIAMFWMSSILRSFMILAGLRCSEMQPRAWIAWMMSPLVFRHLVRLIYTLITGTPITAPGLSGLIAQPTGFINIFISQVLTQVDIYFVWQIILLWIGLRHLPSIRFSQRLLGLLITIISMLILDSLIRTAAVFLQVI